MLSYRLIEIQQDSSCLVNASKMLKTNKMPLSFDDLVKPVYILNAIQKSLDEGREVQISEVM